MTVYHVLKMNGKLAQMQKDIDEYRSQQRQRLEQLKTSVQEKWESVREQQEKKKAASDLPAPALQGKHRQYRRLLRAFPKMQPTRFEEAFSSIKQSIQEKTKSKKKS